MAVQSSKWALRSFITIKISLQKVKAESVFFSLPTVTASYFNNGWFTYWSGQSCTTTFFLIALCRRSSEPWPIATFTSQGWAHGLWESIEYRVQLFADERSTIAQDFAELLSVASPFAPLPMELPSSNTTQHRERRLVSALMAAFGIAGLVLGSPTRNVACKALSMFIVTPFWGTMSTIFSSVSIHSSSLRCVQEGNNEKFFPLGTEIADTPKSVEDLRDKLMPVYTVRGKPFFTSIPSWTFWAVAWASRVDSSSS